MDMVASVELLGVEWLEGFHGDLRPYRGFEIGERVIEVRASHHDVMLDVDDGSSRIEHRHEINASTFKPRLGHLEGAAACRSRAIADDLEPVRRAAGFR